ncbi:hypothetical protein [Polaromonas sp. YR568]|uniref:hypothetical protein n=1 Tax=Polaromonas sp. YR568 TaxID=1855301 RepID=UPI00313846CF
MVKRIQTPAADVSDVVDKAAPAGAVAPDVIAGLDAILEDIGADEKTAEQAASKAGAKVEQQQLDTLEDEVMELLDVVVVPAKALAWFLEPHQFEQLWGRATRKAMAEPLAAIARRHGWSLKNTMSEYGPYLALALAVGPPAMTTAKVYKQAKQWQREQATKPAPVAAPAGGGDGGA